LSGWGWGVGGSVQRFKVFQSKYLQKL